MATTNPAKRGGKRLTAKVERVKQGVQKWAASGRDPSAILKTMDEKVGPLLDAGKVSRSGSRAGSRACTTRRARPQAGADRETRYLAFQIFTYGPDPKIASMGEGKNPIARFPDKATLRDYIEDIKQRIGTVGDRQTRLAVMLGHLSFDHGDAEITRFIELAFGLALETDVAVGFHIDDSMFWAKRKDLWSDPENVEALDWDGTPCTGRRLDWQTGPGAQPDAAPPQMCFNSKVIQREVQQRSALLGKAIQAGVNQLRAAQTAGAVRGRDCRIGDHDRAGFQDGQVSRISRAAEPRLQSRTPAAGPGPRAGKSRSGVHRTLDERTRRGRCFPAKNLLPHRVLLSPRVQDRRRVKRTTYSQHNHFAPPSVAFGKHHRPGFSTYPQPGLFDDIYEELARHKQVAWASCEGTNLQLGSGPGQSGMTMETYLAKMFNHGATLVNIFSWGIGGEANKNMSFRVVTEGEEALRAYRKFLKGEPLIEAKTEALTLLERLPPKIHKIQKELPAWIQKTGDRQGRQGHRAHAKTARTSESQELRRSREDRGFHSEDDGREVRRVRKGGRTIIAAGCSSPSWNTSFTRPRPPRASPRITWAFHTNHASSPSGSSAEIDFSQLQGIAPL